MTIEVTVTQEDISAGVRGDCGGCPVAIALTRATGQPCEVRDPFLEYGPFTEIPGVRENVIVAPMSVKTFIHNFDEGNPVFPFTFEIHPDD